MKTLKFALTGIGTAAVLTTFYPVQAGPKFYFGEGRDLEVFLMGQIWTVYGTNIEIPGATDLKDNKADIYIRRGRFGFKGHLMKNLSFKIWFAHDNLARDDLNPVDIARGAVKTSGLTYSKLEVWDAFFTWSYDKTWANISLGYFRPQIGKESITSGFNMLSFEKGLPNFYVRRHIIGKPDKGDNEVFGRASGNGRIFLINWGGLYKAKGWSLNWNFGVGDNQNYTDSENWSPLWSARVAFTFGDPEMKKYKMGYTQTYFGKRHGITVGLNYGYQGEGVDRKAKRTNKEFDKNIMYGIDILANWGPIDFAAEYDILSRDWSDGADYTDKVWLVKLGYTYKLSNGQFLQPAVSYSVFDPDGNGESIYKNKKNTWWDVGVNWYIKKQRAKLILHYSSGKVENYKSGEDAKSSYIGLGFQFKI
jgi:hypothetical protein